jgi:hypothetical protein
MRTVSVLLATLVLPVSSMAAWFGAEFSADAMQYSPQTKQWQPVGKIYAGKDKLRLEVMRGNQTSVVILDAPQHTTYLINPAERSYMEVKGVQGVPMLAVVPMPDDPSSPCQGGKMTCKEVGEEKIDDTTVEKWEFVVDQKGQQLRSTQWLDPQRKMALRQEFPGGQLVERKFLGKDKLNDREVEKWQVTMRQGNRTQQSTEWIDPKLGVVVRQEAGQGQATELRNIQAGSQPDNLFTVPQDYQKRAMPQSSGGSGMPGGAPGGSGTPGGGAPGGGPGAPGGSGMQRGAPPMR